MSLEFGFALPALNSPGAAPALSLDFLASTSLDSRITFSRASSATMYDSTGTLVYAPMNLLLQSAAFNTTWSPLNVTVTQNTVIAPDGTTSADIIDDGTATGIHTVFQNVTSAASTAYTASCYIKAGTARYAGVAMSSGATNTVWTSVRVDLQTGTVTSATSNSTATIISSSIVSVGSGWFRCSITGTIGAATDIRVSVGVANDGTTFPTTGRGFDSYTGTNQTIYLWGAQLNLFPMAGGVTSSLTTYYPTTTAAYYGPRFDYNPSSFTFQNLLTQSQTFTTAAGWSITSLGFTTSNVAVAPDGTSTATLFDEGTATSAHNASLSLTAGAVPAYTYTVSCYFKYVSRQWVILALSTATSSYASAKFDILNGVLGSTANSGGAFPSAGLTSSITSVGDGWYRCSVTFSTTTTGAPSIRIGMGTDGTTFTASERGMQSYTGTNQQVLVWGAQLTNTSTVQTYYATTTAAYTQCAPRGLLIEEQRSNFITYSEDLTNAAWVLGDNTITSNAIVAPDGNTTADFLVPTAISSTHAFYQASSVTSGNTYTISLYAKYLGTYQFVNFYGSTGFDSTQYINFNVASGTVSTSSGFTGTITSVGNGWYRITVTAVSNATSASGRIAFRASSAARTTGSNSYTGDGTSGVYIWGVQFELGAFATSYIPTTTAATTRSQDVATMTGTNFSSWYNQSQGTFVTQFVLEGVKTVAGQRVITADDGSTTNQILQAGSSSNSFQTQITTAGALQVSQSVPSLTLAGFTTYKSALGYADNNTNTAVNGVLATNDTSCTMPTALTTFRFAASTTTVTANVWFASLRYYPTRFADSTLQVLTT